jgi:hypothetical protein
MTLLVTIQVDKPKVSVGVLASLFPRFDVVGM